MLRITFSSVALLAPVLAQDPAPGWCVHVARGPPKTFVERPTAQLRTTRIFTCRMGYAKAVSPNGGRLTKMEAYWRVGGNPSNPGGFYSPWFGIEASDNLNLIQPVNPWAQGQWLIYNEYFQWEPTNNYDSDMQVVSPGDLLYGRVTFNENNQSYTVYHSDVTTGWSVTSEIAVQRKNGVYKNYTIGYVVYEKSWPCDYYPPEGEVTFFNIAIEYDYKPTTPLWTTGYVDDTCNNRAHIINSTTVQITWNTRA